MGTSIKLVVVATLALSIGVHLNVEAKKPALDIDAKLKLVNKPAVKTIKSEDGDIIDCVDIYKQPAFDNPALKNHKIQMTPNFGSDFEKTSAKTVSAAESVISQIWQRSGSCPNGTIPIRRIQKEDLIRAACFERFARKPAAQFRNSSNLAVDPLEERVTAMLATNGSNYIGAQADINVWNPYVDLAADFTTAQVRLKADIGAVFESIEAGWAVNPQLYGNAASRIYAYWTKEAYQSTGCFDLACSGFVQTSNEVALGTAIEFISYPSQKQYYISIYISMDSLGHWWLQLLDKPVGYWPTSLFWSLKDSATSVEWGGEVFSAAVRKTPHTTTAMGSGFYADGSFGQACFMKNVRVKDDSQTLKYPESVSTSAEEPDCYTTNNSEQYDGEPIFYFGGPGRSPPHCL